MKVKNFISTSLIAALFAIVFAVAVNAQNTTVIVTGNTTAVENTPGWMFNRDFGNATPIAFNSGNASIGYGSLYVLPISNVPAHKFIGENFINAPIADVDSISYDFKIGSGGTAASANQFYMNVYANFGASSDFKFFDCAYNVIPLVGSTANFTTVTFDPTQAYTFRQSGSSPFPCPAVPADMDIASPGSNFRAFAINVGDTSASDVGLDGYYDKVVVATTGGSTTYDFEPILTPTNKDQCKNGGWMTFNTPVFKNQGDCIQFVNNGH